MESNDAAIDRLTRTDCGGRKAAYDAMTISLRDAVLCRLCELAGAQGNERTMLALSVLGDIDDRRACSTLSNVISRSEAAAKREAICALAKLGDPNTAPSVRQCLASDLRYSKVSCGCPAAGFDAAVVEAELYCLGALRDESAIPLLAAAMSHTDEAIRLAAAESLGMIGSAKALEPLVQALDGPERSEEVLAQVVYSMKFIGDASVIHYLRSSSKLSSPKLRILAEHVIGELTNT